MRDRRTDHLNQYQPDYLISWDFSNKDLPCVVISRLRKDGATIVADIIGRTHDNTGCVSLRQVLEDYENRQREEEKRAAARAEQIRKFTLEPDPDEKEED